MSDIRLTNGGIVAEGYLSVHGNALELKDADRRDESRGKPHHRFALVHGTDDQLVINHGGNYKGLVINGGESGLKFIGNAEFSGARWSSELVVKGPDIKLDNDARRLTEGGHRRALVHNSDDGLTLNFRGDYPGGVTIDGEVKCQDIIETSRLTAKNNLGVSDGGSFYAGGRARFKQAPEVPDLKILELGTSAASGRPPVPASLVEIVKELREKVAQLEQQIQTLDA